MRTDIAFYRDLLGDIKTRVRNAQHKAALSANAEMILNYWDIGRMIATRQEKEGWGAGVIPRLAVDLKYELPEEKGFSERNIKLMVQFFQTYPDTFGIGQLSVAQIADENAANSIGQPAVAQLPSNAPAVHQPAAPLSIIQRTVLSVSWTHNVILIQKIKHLPTRLWYARQTLEQGWSRETLSTQIKNNSHARQGGAVTNFAKTLPAVHATVGLILCQTKDRILAEYALRDIHKPIGVADYEITRALPAELASSLPSIEAIEGELSTGMTGGGSAMSLERGATPLPQFAAKVATLASRVEEHLRKMLSVWT